MFVISKDRFVLENDFEFSNCVSRGNFCYTIWHVNLQKQVAKLVRTINVTIMGTRTSLPGSHRGELGINFCYEGLFAKCRRRRWRSRWPTGPVWCSSVGKRNFQVLRCNIFVIAPSLRRRSETPRNQDGSLPRSSNFSATSTRVETV